MAAPIDWEDHHLNRDTISRHVIALPEGRFVALWNDASGASAGAVRAQLFNADGTKAGAAFLIDTPQTQPRSPDQLSGAAGGRWRNPGRAHPR